MQGSEGISEVNGRISGEKDERVNESTDTICISPPYILIQASLKHRSYCHACFA